MAKEIERKFLLKGDAWRKLASGVPYRQGYLNSAKERTVRIRTVGDKAFLTIKGITVGATRAEYEYPISLAECNAMLDTLAEQPLIEKKRYRVALGKLVWEIDEFFGANQGLVVAELELESENQSFDKPDWVGEEVTGDPRYFNSNLISHPYSKWQDTARPGAAAAAPVANVAMTAAEAARIAPRAEFRVFGPQVIETVSQKMWEAGATLQKARRMPAETYILSARTHDANVKVRDGLLDIKLKTGETPEGYEIFQPAGKFRFPVKRADLAAILGHLQVDASAVDRAGSGDCSFEAFLALARAHPDLAVVSVEKMRYGFTIGDVICEYARVWFNGALVETACCESENHAALKGTIEALGIATMPNTSYLKATKHVIGLD